MNSFSKPVLVVYATRQGQTRRVASHLADDLRAHGMSTEIVDVAYVPDQLNIEAYSLAVLAASVHCGQHEREMVDFVKRNRRQLERMPTVFVSVSLSEAGAENPQTPPDRRRQTEADVEQMIQSFLNETGLHPTRVKAAAGALRYSQYNFFLRFIMKRIARQAGAGTDTSKDYEYTDWGALDRFVDDELLPSLLKPAPGATAARDAIRH